MLHNTCGTKPGFTCSEAKNETTLTLIRSLDVTTTLPPAAGIVIKPPATKPGSTANAQSVPGGVPTTTFVMVTAG